MDPEDGWIKPFVGQKIIAFEDSNTSWELTKCLAEKAFFMDDGCEETSEASAIYSCVQIRGPKSSCEAVMRVRLQIPHQKIPWNPNHAIRAREASENRSGYADMEHTALTALTKARCPYTPRFLSRASGRQDNRMWVPRGWIDYILMEKVPGVTPWNFWHAAKGLPQMTPIERDQVRSAFKEALTFIFKHGFNPTDEKFDNILWDKESKKCYFVDLEHFADYRKSPQVLQFQESDYRYWGLKQRGANNTIIE